MGEPTLPCKNDPHNLSAPLFCPRTALLPAQPLHAILTGISLIQQPKLSHYAVHLHGKPFTRHKGKTEDFGAGQVSSGSGQGEERWCSSPVLCL